MARALGARHYSRSDFIATPKGIYYLETNTLPGLTEQSLLPKSLAAVGVPLMTGPEGSGPVNHVLPAWDLMTGAYAAFALVSVLGLVSERSSRLVDALALVLLVRPAGLFGRTA